ncbi:MAG: ECF transporter S component [Clostridiaceae bacterium]|nr:ECF transporter S component [Clostridiaceae bacterium]MBW4860669.1 ECF transporter S component [Clostridiaceae bacterium]MBW4868965.1 ECF transporter S component [Clostridiaceae bacterium]
MRTKYDPKRYELAHKKRTIVSAFIIFIIIPITIFIGIKYLEDRRYKLIGMFIIFYTMLPFFMVFERRRPKARELVMIAVMSALTAVGNLMCFMITPFQPGTAMVILSGISFGAEAGFLVGAIARFVVNFFAGHGPWTPWQMFCWGILGFLSGLIFNKAEVDKVKSRNFQIIIGPLLSIIVSIAIGYGIYTYAKSSGTFFGWWLYAFGAIGLVIGLLIQRKRLPIDDITLSIFGFLATFIIYGGIMNIATMVMASAIPSSNVTMSFKSLAILYISGVPYDSVHGFGTAFFLFAFGERMIKKMERVKIKYRLYV